MRQQIPSPLGARLGGLQRQLFAMGQPQNGHTWEDVVRLGRRTRTPTSQQRFGEHLRGLEGSSVVDIT